MKILTKYFSREFLKLFGLFLFSFLTMYLVIEFILKIDDFIDADVSTVLMFSYLFNNIPFIMVQLTPLATMLSVIVMLCLMERHNEIIAAKACGINIFELSKPLILVALLISLSVFLVSELIVPHTSTKSNEIWEIDLKNKAERRLYIQNHIWYKGSNSIYWIGRFDSKRKTMENLTLYFFDDSFRLEKRIDARKAIWTGDKWEIREGIIQKIINEDRYSLKRFSEIDLSLPEKPDAFLRTMKQPEEMSYWQLKRYARRVQVEGYDATEYLVDMNIKLALPLINVMMILIGIPIALGLKRGGTPMAVSLGIGVCFLYYVFVGFSRSLGFSGMLPPLISAWLGNGVFLLLGIYLMIRLKT
ncbi:MAG: LPS export ABC transporter permease LptG [Thermodesulfobacteriota bacterium]|nr:LPS export ABC transporter permease LptG [Thermodesulfobacteriota bacterium]